MIEEEFAMAKFASKADRDDALLSEIARLRAEVARQHAEILHLRVYAPSQHQAHVVKPIPRVGPTDWRFYGLELAEADFDAFWHTVPNESEA